jgi:formylglycine-generating enzyme required for sulfatase activity
MTQGQWSRLAGVNPAYYTAGRRSPSTPITLRNPVELVSWGDAVELLERFELILPTEAQWEYAARGGTTSVWWTGNDPAKLADAANVSDQSLRALGVPDTWVLEDWNDGHALPAPVGSYRANPFGLHDVHGNVWEWCRDWFLPYTQPCRVGDGLREGVDEAGHRTLRGGAYAQQAIETRSAYRGYDFDGMREDFQGVRPARALAR